MDAKINKLSDELYLITLLPPLSGFDDFIGAWLYKGKTTFIVDVGPSVTAEGLLNALHDINVHHLDYIFLTHIHIDHAGGIGDISARFPKTPIICHEAGISHLCDPSRLWEGTVKTLGDIGRAYGPIKPVPSNRLVGAGQFVSDTIVPIITPGHSPHHVSYQTEKYLFAGEAGGVYLSLPFQHEYLRPATPPRFFLDVTVRSIEKLIAANPEKICYGHFGIRDDAVEMLKMHKNQLFLWKKVIKDVMKHSEEKDLVESCMDRLLKKDQLLAGFFHMDAAVQERERGFLANSIKGFAGYLKTVADNP